MNTTRIYGYTAYYLGLMRAGILCKNMEVVETAIRGLCNPLTKKVGQTIPYFDGDIILTQEDIQTIDYLKLDILKVNAAMNKGWNQAIYAINELLIDIKNK